MGPRRALVAGGVVIMAGYLCLAFPARAGAAIGLVLVAAGTGLYKPNHLALINLLFGDRARREAGISLIYTSIQASALLAPLVIGYLGERVRWQWAFLAAAAVLAVCVVQLVVAGRRLGPLGDAPGRPLGSVPRRLWFAPLVLVVPVAAWIVFGVTGAIAVVALASVLAPFAGYRRLGSALAPAARTRLRAFLWVFSGSALFWMIAAQDGSVLALFARDLTDRTLFGMEVPVSWLPAATPLFVLFLAPAAAWALPRMGGLPLKFSLGLLCAGGSFLLLIVPALASASGRVSVGWLLAVYLLHACGELIIAAVGIAATADVVPAAYLSQALGLWWLFAALGGGLGSQLARVVEVLGHPVYFFALGTVVTVTGLVMMARRHAITRALSHPDDVADPAPMKPSRA
ncbi:oligopeptide:H+ symporter [Amycolatopsis sp. A133]|nr:oligopeptide:H+ symporter [Amycolatopsis sp. A133]MDQ7803486.1 oligopeptide:H+ symporter [Amycolatopsis sp. A133]